MSPLVVLIVAVLATTYAGPVVRFAAAPALAIAFWRLTLILPVTGLIAALQGSGEQGAGSSESGAVVSLPAPRSLLPLFLASGLLLGMHFWSWIASLRYTTVASSVLLVSLKPVFAWGIAAVWLREHPTRTEAWGIVVAVLGASLIGIGDARLTLGALGGDTLALLGAVTGAGYYVIGRRVRQTVGVWRYATAVYAVAAVVLGVVAWGRGVPLVGFGRRDWAVFAALAAGPMLVGHTGMNYALRQFRATTVNVAALGEPVGASLIAWLLPAIHEVPRVTTIVGGVLVVLGIAASLGAGNREQYPPLHRKVPLPAPGSPGGGHGRGHAG
jgi:drug/metabolite transporter (DMT)-like permease